MPLKRWAKFLILCFVSAAIILGTCAYWLVSFLHQPVTPPGALLMQVKPGTSLTRIALDFEEAGVISDARRFILLARWHDASSRIHAGEYLFNAAAAPGEVLDRLVAGDVRKLQLTIPEGFNLAEIAARVEAADIGPASEFLALASDPRLIASLAIKAETLEGYLFPETYTYTSNTSQTALLTAMVDQCQKHLTPALIAAAQEQGLDRHQLLTLASIIQKEAGNSDEMPLIAAVFHNRLKLGIPLQADPTVIYGIKDFDGNLTRRHLSQETPYNTYKHRGLPPGPIASPGLAALHAAAHPADVKYLYFVAKGDGSHVFNATLNEHNRAVQHYQLRR
jgi:UPF0755 protein